MSAGLSYSHGIPCGMWKRPRRAHTPRCSCVLCLRKKGMIQSLLTARFQKWLMVKELGTFLLARKRRGWPLCSGTSYAAYGDPPTKNGCRKEQESYQRVRSLVMQCAAAGFFWVYRWSPLGILAPPVPTSLPGSMMGYAATDLLECSPEQYIMHPWSGPSSALVAREASR